MTGPRADPDPAVEFEASDARPMDRARMHLDGDASPDA